MSQIYSHQRWMNKYLEFTCNSQIHVNDNRIYVLETSQVTNFRSLCALFKSYLAWECLSFRFYYCNSTLLPRILRSKTTKDKILQKQADILLSTCCSCYLLVRIPPCGHGDRGSNPSNHRIIKIWQIYSHLRCINKCLEFI